MLTKWATSLTKLLWELGNKNVETTQLIFQVLSTLAKKRARVSKDLFGSLQLSLVPFFSVGIPSKTGDDKVTRVFGPFTSLPTQVQRMAIDLLYYFDDLPPKLLQGLAPCLNSVTVDATVVRHALQIISLKQALFEETSHVYISFLASIWTGYSQDELARLREHHAQRYSGPIISAKTILETLHLEASFPASHLWRRRMDISQGLVQSLCALRVISASEFVELVSESVFVPELVRSSLSSAFGAS